MAKTMIPLAYDVATSTVDVLLLIGLFRFHLPWWLTAVLLPVAVVARKFIVNALWKAAGPKNRKKKIAKKPKKEEEAEELPATVEWLNRILVSVWQSHRAYASRVFLDKFWPQVQKKVAEKTSLAKLTVHDFSVGDRPPRVLNVQAAEDGDDLRFELEACYSGNAYVKITAELPGGVSVPVTVRRAAVSYTRLCVVVKALTGRPPFHSGLQVFLVELPDFTYEMADAGKLIDLPVLDDAIRQLVDAEIRENLVLPNRLTLPAVLPNFIEDKLGLLGFTDFSPRQ